MYDGDFNSIKVRLKPNTPACRIITELFQFHKGTIKTSSFSECMSTYCDFNSIKVRLKQTIHILT